MVPPQLNDQLASTAFCVLRADPEKADARFIYYSLLTESFRRTMKNLQRGASYPAVADSDVLEQVILHPPLPEQRSIADHLSAIQEASQNQRKIVEKLRQLKAATMAKLFREGLRGEPLKQTDIGEIPNGWETTKLADGLTMAQYGLSVRGEPAREVPILRMNCQENGRVKFRDLQFVNLDAKTLEAFLLRPGDILFNRTNSHELVGRTALFDSDQRAVFASYLLRIRANPECLDPEFLNFYLNLPAAQQRLRGLATQGVSQSNISASKLKEFFVPRPPLGEQTEIAGILRGVEAAEEMGRSRLTSYETLFASVLVAMMGGSARSRKNDGKN